MLKKMLPRLRVNSIYDIDLAFLEKTGIRGIITDLDNTLVGAKVTAPTPELVEWLNEVKERGFQIVIVSNNNYERVSAFAEPIQMPFIHKAKKPVGIAFRNAMAAMGLDANEIAVIGDQMLTDVLGGNRLGMYTILVKPIAIEDEKLTTKLNRRVEKWVLRKLKKKGLYREEEI